MKKTVKVIAAIIENDQNEILGAMRSPEMSISNMWEFPGGKVEPNEDLFESLTREIKEELHFYNLSIIIHVHYFPLLLDNYLKFPEKHSD